MNPTGYNSLCRDDKATYGWEKEQNPHGKWASKMDETDTRDYQGCPCRGKGYPKVLGCSVCEEERSGTKTMDSKKKTVPSPKCNWSKLAELGIYP